jgi:hypothetical protein
MRGNRILRPDHSNNSREGVANQAEGIVDVRSHSLHPCSGSKSDQCNDQRILNQVLTVFARHEVPHTDGRVSRI